MAEATELQVQQWAERIRVRCESLRNINALCEDDNGSIGSVYEHLTGSNTWTDQRNDSPPNLLTGGDLLAINTLSQALARILGGHTYANDTERAADVAAIQNQLPIVTKACVRPITVVIPQ